MQTIGERLEEARKRAGVSLREASEATKIRADYLQQMEHGSFSFNLPEVYKRGFLKIYARYLKLDPEKTAADFNAQILASSRTSRRDTREHLGRVELPGHEGSAAGADDDSSGHSAGAMGGDEPVDRASLAKLAIFFVVALVALGVIYIGLQSLINRGPAVSTAATSQNTSVSANPPKPGPAPNTPKPAPNTPKPVLTPIKLTFSAQDDISNLKIVQMSDQKVLFDDKLARGKPVTINSSGPVEISVSNAQFLVIEQNGSAMVPGDSSGKPLTGPKRFHWPPGS